jgi:hypothetical protein
MYNQLLRPYQPQCGGSDFFDLLVPLIPVFHEHLARYYLNIIVATDI